MSGLAALAVPSWAVTALEMAGKALGFVRKHWKLAAFIALGAVCAFQRVDLRHKDKVIAGKEAALKVERDGRKADQNTYRLASEKARADAEAKARAKDQQNAKLKEEADNALLDRDRIAAANSRLSEWVRQHPAQGGSGRGDMPADPAAAALDHGQGGLAAVDEGTLQICTRNTERLLNAQEWGQKLNADPIR